jgi:hypothetical protein
MRGMKTKKRAKRACLAGLTHGGGGVEQSFDLFDFSDYELSKILPF